MKINNDKLAKTVSPIKQSVSITVFIPVYNGEPYLEQTIKSILSQSFKEYDVLIIDDCSIDNSKTIIKKYQDEPNFRAIYRDANLGLAASIRTAATISNSDYLMILGQDDRIPENYIENCIESLLSKPAILHSSYIVDSNGMNYTSNKLTLNKLLHFFRFDSSYGLAFGNTISTVGVFINKNMLKQVLDTYNIELIYEIKGTKIKLYSEYFTWIKLSELGSIVFNSKVKTIYLKHNNSMTSNLKEKIKELYLFDDLNRKVFIDHLYKNGNLSFVVFMIIIYFPYMLIKKWNSITHLD
jgi:glycosyltransferase involved in cell wall biosynthesis